MLKRHEVEILLKAGHPKTEVARLSGVSLRAVRRMAQEEPVVRVDDEVERSKRHSGRLSTAQNFRKRVVGILAETPDLPSLEILHGCERYRRSNNRYDTRKLPLGDSAPHRA